jgi:hypothetical protein
VIHALEHIATYRFLDPAKFKDYATKYAPRLLTDCGAVTSWDVDALLKGYIEFIGQTEYEADRLAIIAAR